MEPSPRKPLYTHDKEFHDIVHNPDRLKKAAERLLMHVVDDLTLGIIFDVHKKHKMRLHYLDGEDAHGNKLKTLSHVNSHNKSKKACGCLCPICNRNVAATRFAPHLATCMGVHGRKSQRNASKQLAKHNSLSSDEEVDSTSSNKGRKKKHRTNGNKKGRGTPKKNNNSNSSNHSNSNSSSNSNNNSEADSGLESFNVDIEGDDDGDISLKDFLHDSSNHSSPSDRASTPSSSSSGSRKRDRAGKSKKNIDR